MNMRLAVAHTITNALIARLKLKRVDTVIYFEISPEVDLDQVTKDFTLIYGFKNFTEINNVTFDLVRDNLYKLKKGMPTLFSYKGYDLLEGLAKDLFWGLYENNAITYHIDKCKSLGVEKIYNFYSRKNIIKRLALIKKLFLGKNLLYRLILNPKEGEISDSTVAFRVNEFEMIEMYGDLMQNLQGEPIVSFQNIVRKNAEELHKGLGALFTRNYRPEHSYAGKNTIPFSHRLRLAFSGMDADFLNVTADGMFKLINHIEEYEKLAKLGLKRFFVAAAENEGEGNILCQVAARYGGITYNYMNGAKGKEHNNIHTDFTYWFMPDLSTQQLILSYCNVTKEQVPVTGHLLEEKAQNYKYSGTLNDFSGAIEGKKIIALFSSPVHKKEQMDVIAVLNDYLDKNQDVIVLIRKHPFDNRTRIGSHDRMILLPGFEGKLYNLSLFDLFNKAELTISFSSTVSLQSTWFALPTLNVEYAAVSLLPYVDDKKIMHVNNMELLNTLLDKYLKSEEIYKGAHEFVPVSANIIRFLKMPLPGKSKTAVIY